MLFVLSSAICWLLLLRMAEKRRYTVSLPDHVADAVDAHSKPLGATPTEYAGDIIRWWFGQGCPPVRADESALRRIKPVPKNLNVWSLDPKNVYILTDDSVVQMLLDQLGLPNLFAHEKEHDEVRMSLAFDNHPTHWLEVNFFKGSNKPGGDGLSFNAYPKATTSREEMISKMQGELKKMGAKGSFNFSQIPILEAAMSGGRVPNKDIVR
jgi:hypothetical protein